MINAILKFIVEFLQSIAKAKPSLPTPPVSSPVVNRKIVMLKATLYYLCLESDYKTEAEFIHAAAIEGSAKRNDGEVYNISGGKFIPVSAPFGLGAKNNALVPLRSVAVDRTVVPLGSKLFIKELVGLTLSDGSKHDGHMSADDVGGAIKENRIDIFCGAGKASMKALYDHGISHMRELTVEIL